MAANHMPDQAYLRECFDYDPETGILTWKHRPRTHFRSDRALTMWASRFALRRAGNGNGKNHRKLCLDGKHYKVHRLIWVIMTGSPPRHLLDHIDGDEQNNRWSNLREATHQQNQWNKDSYRALPKGIYYNPKRQKPYVVQIVLGSFSTLDEAVSARLRVAEALHGEFFHA